MTGKTAGEKAGLRVGVMLRTPDVLLIDSPYDSRSIGFGLPDVCAAYRTFLYGTCRIAGRRLLSHNGRSQLFFSSGDAVTLLVFLA